MADSVEINISDLAKTQQKLYDFSAKLGDRVTLLALRAGANFMLKNIRQAEPVKTGRLRRATVVKNSRINQRRRNGKVGVYITVKPGKSRKDERGAWYGKFVENGFNRGSKLVTGAQAVGLGIITRDQLNAKKASNKKFKGKNKQGIRYRHGGQHVEGKKFVKNTFNANRQQSLDIILTAIESGGDRLAKLL